MSADLTFANERLKEFEGLVESGTCSSWDGDLRIGVDLGTANIVVAVTDADGRPIAGASHPSRAVRDGIVVDYIGAVNAVTKLKKNIEDLMRIPLDKAACAIPPGIIEGNVKVISNVCEGAGFRVTNVVDEPTAAASVLGIKDGAVVDVGGGTTGISILKDGKVIFTGDEPTGGTHMTLVLAGAYSTPFEEAELIKRDPAQESRVYPVIRPVVEKMAAIVKRFLEGYDVETVYVVGGACCFEKFEETFEKYLGIPVIKPAAPLLVTPLGIAMNCTL